MPDTDPDVFLSKIYQMHHELDVLDETVSTGRLTTIIILDALPAEMFPTVKLEAIRYPDLSLEQIQGMLRTIFMNHSEKLSVTKKIPEFKRYQESGMSIAFITCHYCKKPGHKVKDYKRTLEREYDELESLKISIMRERKSDVVIIKQTVIRISSVTSKWESRKNSKIEDK